MIRIGLQRSVDRSTAFNAVESRLEAMFCGDSEDVDAAVSDTVEGASDALAAGKHVLLDALEAISIAELEALSETASANGRLVMPAHVWRFIPSVIAAQSSLAAGSLGDLGLVRIHRWKSTRDPREVRRMLLADLDNVILFYGDLPESIHAVRRPDYLQLHLGWKGDGMAMIDHAMARAPGTDYDSLTLVGSKGAAYADDHHNMNLLFTGDRPAGLRVGHGSVPMTDMLKDFLEAIREECQPAVTLSDTIRAMTAVEALAGLEQSTSVHLRLIDGNYETR